MKRKLYKPKLNCKCGVDSNGYDLFYEDIFCSKNNLEKVEKSYAEIME